MKKFLLCVVALLSSHVMHAQYFCSEEGTELRYVNYDGAGQGISDENITRTIPLIHYIIGVTTVKRPFVPRI